VICAPIPELEAERLEARKDVFPNLNSIVVAGHSAGGQFVIRYEMCRRKKIQFP
jgi:hypothetical protein